MRARDDGTDLLLELLVDGIAGVLDGDALHVAGGHFEAEGEVEVDFLDRGVAEELVEDVLFFDGCGGAVDFPGRGGQLSVDCIALTAALREVVRQTSPSLHSGGRK